MEDSKELQIKFLITGGHLTPAKAVIDELKSRGFKNFQWVGRKFTMRGDKTVSAEYQLIHKDLGIPFADLTTGKVVRFSNIRSFVEFIINLAKIPIGLVSSLLILLRYRPKVIVSFGGYVALPLVIMGKLLGIKSVTHEQTVVVGLANKVISKFVDKVLISWEGTRKYFKSSKVVLTGNPIRKEVLKVSTDVYKLNPKLPVIYITGGNQGAHVINRAVIGTIDKLLERYNVIHQTGLTTVTNDYEECRKIAKLHIGSKKGRYIVRGNIFGNEIGEVFSKAALVISRAGANIVTDILALGKMAILTPIPWSIHNEQMLNAEMVEKLGLAKIIKQNELTPEVFLKGVSEAMKGIKSQRDFNGDVLEESQKKARSLVRLDASEKIVDEVLSLT